jgi:hypothetical protein
MSVAERAVPEWQATLDALLTLPDFDAGTPIGYAGVTLGAVTGLKLAAVEPRIAALSVGAVFVHDALIEAARQITVPVQYRMPWDDGNSTERPESRCSMPSPRRRRSCARAPAGTTRCPTTSVTARPGSSPAASPGHRAPPDAPPRWPRGGGPTEVRAGRGTA